MRDKADTASIMLIGRVVKPLTGRQAPEVLKDPGVNAADPIYCPIQPCSCASLFPFVAEPMPAKHPAPKSIIPLIPYSHMANL